MSARPVVSMPTVDSAAQSVDAIAGPRPVEAIAALEPHPYAEAWPLLGEDELAELSADVGVNGLREPITLYWGMILDGRNRAAACAAVGVELRTVEFAGDDDAALAFVQSVNNSRRHQSKGSLASSWALSMLAAGKRDSGKWSGTRGKPQKSEGINYQMQSQLGTIADYAPPLLYQVRSDELSLNAAYEKACHKRDEAARKIAEQAEAEKEEADARAFIEREDPDLAARVNGDDLQSFVEALDLWKRRNREEADRIAAEKAKAEREKREYAKAMTDLYSGMARCLQVAGGYGKYENITELMAEFSPDYLDPPQFEREFSIENLQSSARFINNLITWQETR